MCFKNILVNPPFRPPIFFFLINYLNPEELNAVKFFLINIIIITSDNKKIKFKRVFIEHGKGCPSLPILQFLNIVQYSAVIVIIMHIAYIAYSKAKLKASHFLVKAFMEGIAFCGGAQCEEDKTKRFVSFALSAPNPSRPFNVRRYK